MLVSNKKIDKSLFIPLLSSKCPIILDVGCCDGQDSFEFLELFPNAIVYAFDADPRSIDLFTQLWRLQAANVRDRIFVAQLAICDTNGWKEWYGSESSIRSCRASQATYPAASSLKKPAYQRVIAPDLSYNKSLVYGVSLDEWVKTFLPNTDIDLVWVDVNGAEEDFINGGLFTLQNKVKYLHIEFSDKVLFEKQITKDEMIEKLACFELLGIYDYLGNYGNLFLRNNKL